MITKAQIIRRSSKESVPAKTIERDYVLAHAVAAIAQFKGESKLVFKGGTALRLCHFEDYRYSADLDFSIIDNATIEESLLVIEEALRHTTTGEISWIDVTSNKPPRISYIGPLGKERTIKLDLADDEYVVNTEYRSLLLRWPDLPQDTQIKVYTPLEIAAEKLRCILQRLQCRDLFDLHVLFGDVGVDPRDAASLFEPKAVHRGFDPNSFCTKYAERINQYEKRWSVELREHVPGDLPRFTEVKRAVSRYLRHAGLI